jgi:hypothetical protein
MKKNLTRTLFCVCYQQDYRGENSLLANCKVAVWRPLSIKTHKHTKFGFAEAEVGLFSGHRGVMCKDQAMSYSQAKANSCCEREPQDSM